MSEELDEWLPDQVSGLVVESALKTSSKRKRRAAAKKKKIGLNKEPPNRMLFKVKKRNSLKKYQV